MVGVSLLYINTVRPKRKSIILHNVHYRTSLIGRCCHSLVLDSPFPCCYIKLIAGVAQLVEQRIRNPQVRGSSPLAGSI